MLPATVFESLFWTCGVWYAYNKIVMVNMKKRNLFLQEFPSKWWFRSGIHSLLGRFDIKR